MSQKIKWGLTFSLFLFFVMNSALGSSEMNHSPVLINMENWAPYYRPYEAAILSQTPIQWKNPTASPHTVRHDDCATDRPCLFDSGAVAPDGSYTISGLAPGRYLYHCELHPIMRGELIIDGRGIDFTTELASLAKKTKD